MRFNITVVIRYYLKILNIIITAGKILLYNIIKKKNDMKGVDNELKI